MEKLDKNYIIGFVLLFVMYGTYMFFYSPPEEPIKEDVKVEQKGNVAAKSASIAPITPDTAILNSTFGAFSKFMVGTEEDVVLENDHLSIMVSTKGGQIKKAFLKKYQTYDDYNVGAAMGMDLLNQESSNIELKAGSQYGEIVLSDLYYTIKSKSKNELILAADLGNNASIEHYFKLDSNYAVSYQLKLNGTQGLITGDKISYSWENKLRKLEHDMAENRKATQVNYYTTEESYEDVGLGSQGDDNEVVEEAVKWFSFKQKYFTTGIIADGGAFEKLNITLRTPTTDSAVVKDAKVVASLPLADINAGKGSFKYYFGPNEFSVLKAQGNDFHQNLYLGYDIVKPINRFVFVPLFNWFEKFVSNYGLLIILVVLAIKLALTPLIYKSYVSSAKMRVLAPEIAEIKEKVGDDQVKVQQETMKLYQQVGVSPLSGCVPMLLQMPILMSVFFLFPNMIMFRQKSFLWANDLSTYDSPLSWGFDLPIIGNHISLFVVLMTASSLAFTYYNNQVTPDQPGPIDMKKLSYIFPLVFFFVLNSFPAALSFYYLVSNVVTIGQQLTVKKFIDEDKILSILQENKRNFHTKPKKANKFADYLQKQLQVQEESNKQKADSLKNKKNKK